MLRINKYRFLNLLVMMMFIPLTASCASYYSVPAAVCLSAEDNPDDNVWRFWGYAYTAEGTSVYQAWLNCPVNLPQGAEIEAIRCGVKDTDSSGTVKMYLYKLDMSGNSSLLAFDETDFGGTPGDTTLVDDTISSPTVDNIFSSYYIRIYLQEQRIHGGHVRFNMCSITYDTP